MGHEGWMVGADTGGGFGKVPHRAVLTELTCAHSRTACTRSSSSAARWSLRSTRASTVSDSSWKPRVRTTACKCAA